MLGRTGKGAFLAGAFAFLVIASMAGAAPLGLHSVKPDVTAGFIYVNYTSSSGEFFAQGDAASFVPTTLSPEYAIDNGAGAYTIDVMLDGSGTPLSGTLSIGGTITDLGATSGTLLTGTVSKFGFDPAGGSPPIFEFIFDVNGGDLQSRYGNKAGVILTGWDISFDGTFGSDFSDMYGATADTFKSVSANEILPAVPALPAGLVGLFGLALRRSLRRQRA